MRVGAHLTQSECKMAIPCGSASTTKKPLTLMKSKKLSRMKKAEWWDVMLL